jgi:hypothetical protein
VATSSPTRPAAPRERVAQHLYETMERLAPGHDNFVEWDCLTKWHRDLYMNCIDALFDDPDLLLRAFNLSDNDVVNRCLEEGKKAYVNDKISDRSIHDATS